MKHLPSELKIIILDFLPVKDLLNMATTNKANYELIRTSQKLMAKLVFVVKSFAEQQHFMTKVKDEENALLFHRVKVLQQSLGVRMFKSLLACLGSVRELELKNINLTNTKKQFYNDISLPYLRKLKLSG